MQLAFMQAAVEMRTGSPRCHVFLFLTGSLRRRIVFSECCDFCLERANLVCKTPNGHWRAAKSGGGKKTCQTGGFEI